MGVNQYIKNECIQKVRQLGHSLGKEILLPIEKKIQFAKNEDEIKEILSDLRHKYLEFVEFDAVGIDDFFNKLHKEFDREQTKQISKDHIKSSEDEIILEPYFYDSYKNWWLWNFQKYKWEMVDEVDVLNMYAKVTNESVISGKRTIILNKLKLLIYITLVYL